MGDSCLPAAPAVSSPPEGVPGTVPSFLVPPPPVPMMDCRFTSRSASELEEEEITDNVLFVAIRDVI